MAQERHQSRQGEDTDDGLADGQAREKGIIKLVLKFAKIAEGLRNVHIDILAQALERAGYRFTHEQIQLYLSTRPQTLYQNLCGALSAPQVGSAAMARAHASVYHESVVIDSPIGQVNIYDYPEAPSISECLHRLRTSYCQERETDAIDHFFPDYERHSASETIDGGACFDAETGVTQWLAMKTSPRVMLLLGHSGIGKSRFAMQLEDTLWALHNEDNQSPIPIRLYLGDFDDKSVESCILETLKTRCNLLLESDLAVVEALQNLPFVFIADAYDEIQSEQRGRIKHLNIYQRNHMHKWRNSRLVITCRTEYLLRCRGSDSWFVERTGRPISKLYLQGLKPTQVGTLIEKCDFIPAERKQMIQAALQDEKVQSLVCTPLLLRIFVDAYQPGESIPKNRWILYQRFAMAIFSRQSDKITQSNLSLTGFEDPLEWLQQSVQQVAAALYHCRLNQIVKGQDALLDDLLSGKNAALEELRRTCPLKRTGDASYRFIHSSFKAFFFCQQLLALARENVSEAQDNWAYIFFSEDSHLLDFLIEGFEEEVDADKQQIKALLQYWIEQSGLSGKEVASSNAASLLSGIQHHLQGINTHGALLRRARLENTDLRGQDLRAADLRETYLENSAFWGAQISAETRIDTLHLDERQELTFEERQVLLAAEFTSSDSLMVFIKESAVLKQLRYSVSSGYKITEEMLHTIPSVSYDKLVPNALSQTVCLFQLAHEALLWNLKTGGCQSLNGTSVLVERDVQYSLDGCLLAVSTHGGVSLWQTDTAKQLYVFSDVSSVTVYRFLLVPQYDQILIFEKSGKLHTWYYQESRVTSSFYALPDMLPRKVVASPCGQYIALLYEKNLLSVFGIEAQQCVQQFTIAPGINIQQLCFINASLIVIVSRSGSLQYWDTHAGTCLSPLVVCDKVNRTCVLNTYGSQRLSVLVDNKKLFVLPMPRQGIQPLYSMLTDYLSVMTLSHHTNVNARLLAIGELHGAIHLWSFKDGVEIFSNIEEHFPWRICSLAFSQDNTSLVAKDQKGRVSLWKVQDDRVVLISSMSGVFENRENLARVYFSHNQYVIDCSGGVIRILDIVRNREVSVAHDFRSQHYDRAAAFFTVLVQADNTFIITVESDGKTMHTWDWRGNELSVLSLKHKMTQLLPAPDGKHFVIVDNNGHFIFYDFNLKVIRNIDTSHDYCFDLAMRGSNENYFYQYCMVDSEPSALMICGHGQKVTRGYSGLTDVRFTPGGALAATYDKRSKSMSVYDVFSGTLLFTLRLDTLKVQKIMWHESYLFIVCFHRILCFDFDSTVLAEQQYATSSVESPRGMMQALGSAVISNEGDTPAQMPEGDTYQSVFATTPPTQGRTHSPHPGAG